MTYEETINQLYNASEYLDMISDGEQHIAEMIKAIDEAMMLIKTHCKEEKYICNSCHEHYPSNEMDIDPEDESDICKDCNQVLYDNAPTNKVREAKQILKEAGYYTDNLWSVEDVQDIFDCSDEEAQDVLKNTMTNEGTMHHIWSVIRFVGQDKSLKEI